MGPWAKQALHSPAQTEDQLSAEADDGSSSYSKPKYQRYERALNTALARISLASTALAAVKQCMREFERAAAALGPLWRVRPFGGISNGFAMPGSDLDVTCYLEGMEVGYTPYVTEELRTRLLPLLQKHPRFEVVDQIWTARVPILKLRFDRQLDVDLSCHNTEALHNTQLLRSYAELSPQVRELGLLVKLWAKGEGVCGAPQGYLSSYALTLMALYFLQVDPEVKMPCLPAVRYSEGATRKRVEWSCPWTAPVLLARFFRFYTTEFQWGAEVVSVRLGRRSCSSDPAYDQLRASLSPRLHLEDPFLTGRNLHCVLGLQQECFFYLKLCQAGQAIRCGSLPAGLRRTARSAHSLRMTAQTSGVAATPPSTSAAAKAAVVDEMQPMGNSGDSTASALAAEQLVDADTSEDSTAVQNTSSRTSQSGNQEGERKREPETDSSGQACEEHRPSKN